MVPLPDSAVGRADRDWSARRSDARRNHEQIMAAAIEVFSEKGLTATVTEVAARAGVGKATVYRSYPTKDALVQAVAEHQIRWVDTRVAQAAAQEDPYLALRDFLDDLFQRLVHDPVLLAEVMPREELRAATVGSLETLERIVVAARDRGALRADVTVLDLRILSSGCARALADLGNRDPQVWRRFAGLVLAALGPAEPSCPADGSADPGRTRRAAPR